MTAYLRRHQFDGEQLRRRTMEEFAVAMRSGRLIAFVGAYVNKEAGYPDWDLFLMVYADLAQNYVARAIVDGNPQKQKRARQGEAAISAIRAAMPTTGADDNEKRWDNALTSISVIKQVLLYVEDTPAKLDKTFAEIGKLFHLKSGAASPTNAELIVDLRIDRVITLNYDLEFEWLLMTTAGEKQKAAGAGRMATFQKLLKDGWIATGAEPVSHMRILADGRSVISDVFSRERTDRLIEFAVGSPDYEGHILHLHGVALAPETMVVSQWDYNRQYRRSGISKLPFEHALRVLFAGNPILFVGVGMSEREVTATLEQIVSDHPGRRIAPAFILWNAPWQAGWNVVRAAYEKEAFRFRWWHRFGVLTIFDDEIPAAGPVTLSLDEGQRFKDSIGNLAAKAVEISTPFSWGEQDFRNIDIKLKNKENRKTGHYDIWPPDGRQPVRPSRIALARNQALKDRRLFLFAARPGAGKGRAAKRLRSRWHRDVGANGRSMIINASFVFEIESVFALISGLSNGKTAQNEHISRRQSMTNYVSEELKGLFGHAVQGGSPRLLIVINGMERFFSPSGQPLSTELDGLLRSVVRIHNFKQTHPALQGLPANPALPQFQIAILGTNRVRSYFDALHIEKRDALIADIGEELNAEIEEDQGTGHSLPSRYFRRLRDNFEKDNFKSGGGFKPVGVSEFLIGRKCGGDPGELRRHFLGAYLQTEALTKAGVSDPDLCFDILTVMAYIGQPIEDAVLFHAPRIQKRLSALAPREQARSLDTAIDQLRKLELILPRGLFESSPSGWRRYGLHRSVLTEMRDRVGVPLSDSKLSGGFNISLFAAQPVDGYSPQADIHEELDMLVDWLIGAYKDVGLDQCRSASAALPTLQVAPTTGPKGRPEPARAAPHVSACLRAALATVRNYYSTSALLTLDPTDHDERGNRDGPLTRHAERLDRLIAAAIDNTCARRAAPRQATKRWRLARRDLGPPPFYPDDLVWLFNERGVVKLTQGDLYEARYSFDEALRLNQQFVEFDDPSNNWRHLMLNQLHVDIERARLDRAEQRIGEIERSIAALLDSPFAKISKRVVRRYGRKVSSKSHVVDADLEHDVILSVGLIFGYRGLCMHLAGEFKLASEMFQVAVNILENIGEQRAYAMFQRYFASLKAALGQIPEALEALKVAIASSEATRQIDVAHHARITEAWHHQRAAKADAVRRSTLIRNLQRSLRYAAAGEMHRVRVEAGLNLARIKLDGGDYDSALERVADAMATATRYGMSLRKISLRILMGQILMRRGDHVSGANLIDRATRNADRVGYQGAVGLAQRVQALEENPATGPEL
jgi:tetratricopeptide (TPR) repeat protein